MFKKTRPWRPAQPCHETHRSHGKAAAAWTGGAYREVRERAPHEERHVSAAEGGQEAGASGIFQHPVSEPR